MKHDSAITPELDSTCEDASLGNPWITPEGLNCLTHALGLLLSLFAVDRLLPAIRQGTNRALAVGLAVYAASLVAVYLASTLSHSFQAPRVRHFFRTLDQVFIFFLIAGSYTPWGLAYFPEGWGQVLLAAFWIGALAGALVKLLVKGHQNVATAAYVVLGWLPMFAIKPILELVPFDAMAWLLAGGVLYTAGTYFLSRDVRYPYFHAVWHLLVIGGSACHFLGVLFYIVPICYGG